MSTTGHNSHFGSGFGQGYESEDPRVLIAAARARNHEVITRVVDESIERAAELRKQREERDEVRRREERRQERIEAAERAEREEAEEIAARQRELEARQEDEDATRRSMLRQELAEVESSGPFDRFA